MARPLTGSLGKRTIVIAAALIVGLAVGSVGVALALAGGSDQVSAPFDQAATQWPVNALGQTYGSSALATCPEDEPDLIAAAATNGQVGYISRAEAEAVDGSQVKNPEEALAWQATEGRKTHAIPVYGVDGMTQIGVFLIEPGEAFEIRDGAFVNDDGEVLQISVPSE